MSAICISAAVARAAPPSAAAPRRSAKAVVTTATPKRAATAITPCHASHSHALALRVRSSSRLAAVVEPVEVAAVPEAAEEAAPAAEDPVFAAFLAAQMADEVGRCRLTISNSS
jgi:hypothetical protein